MKPAVAAAIPMSPLATLTIPSVGELVQDYPKSTLGDFFNHEGYEKTLSKKYEGVRN